MAESSKRLSRSLKDEHPDFPWKEIVGFRNVLVHDYLGVNLARVWTVVEQDAPNLESMIEGLLERIKSGM